MKKILFLNKNLRAGGGTERSTITIANELANNNFKVYLLSITHGNYQESIFKINDNIIEINLDIDNISKNYISICRLLQEIVIKEKIDIIIFSEVYNFIFSSLLIINKKKLKCKIIAWEHFNCTVDLGRRFRKFSRVLAGLFADKIITLTDKDRLLWNEKYKISNSIVTIPNASPFKNDDFLYSNESKKIIAVGRLSYQKGFDLLIKIWKILVYEKGIINSKLEIIGSGEDEAKLREMILVNNLDEFISINTSNPVMEDYYKEASFLVMTSRFEGLPMVLIEAQSFCLPIIAYDCLTGPSDIIIKNSGFLIPFGNEELFVSAIVKMIENDRARKEMAYNSFELSSRYKLENIIQLWKNLLTSL